MILMMSVLKCEKGGEREKCTKRYLRCALHVDLCCPWARPLKSLCHGVAGLLV